MKSVTAVLLFYMVLIFSIVGGYITNVIWILKHMSEAFGGEMIIALLGLFTPLGFLHGIYLWF